MQETSTSPRPELGGVGGGTRRAIKRAGPSFGRCATDGLSAPKGCTQSHVRFVVLAWSESSIPRIQPMPSGPECRPCCQQRARGVRGGRAGSQRGQCGNFMPMYCPVGNIGPVPKARAKPVLSKPLIAPCASVMACSCANPVPSESPWPCTRPELKS